MNTLLKLMSNGWEITLKKNWDGYYIDIRGDGIGYMGYDQFKFSAAIRDLENKMKATGAL